MESCELLFFHSERYSFETGASTGRNYFMMVQMGQFVYAGFLIKFSIDPDKVVPKYVKYYCLSQEIIKKDGLRL